MAYLSLDMLVINFVLLSGFKGEVLVKVQPEYTGKCKHTNVVMIARYRRIREVKSW